VRVGNGFWIKGYRSSVPVKGLIAQCTVDTARLSLIKTVDGILAITTPIVLPIPDWNVYLVIARPVLELATAI